MGATTFFTTAPGETAEAAFRAARDRALYERGHGGYTGSVAEKHEFVMIQHRPLPEREAATLADRLIEEGDRRIDDKWGPAGCVPLEGADGAVRRWLFFGWASE
jgi:hypothetical protein